MRPLISLDVFDTAIFRKVFKPTDIFCVVEDEVGCNFHNLRIEAQDRARRKSIFYNIFDIYKYIPQFNLKEEIKAEYSNCKANPYILDMYNTLDADFIFISDMYLPEKVIVGMLERCGYRNPKVFVSCDYNAMKSDGKLFKVVQEAIGRKIDKHIGDNYHCDILGAKRAGIPETEYIGPAIYNKEVITPELKDVRLRKLLIDEELSNADIAEKIGYWFAPLVLSFTKKVLDEATYDQTIFFNARDSFLMYVTARWILKTDKKIKYCRFSRKSCFVPNLVVNRALNHPDNARSFSFFKIQRIKTIRELLRTYELDEEKDYSSILKDYGVNIDSNIELSPKRQAIIEQVLLYNQRDLYAKAIQDRQNFLKYISKLGMKDGDVWADIGYEGTMQAIIQRIAHINLEGKYIVTKGGEKGLFHNYHFTRKSFLPDGFINGYGGAILEFVFSESKGTVSKYNNEGKPELLGDSKFRKEVTKRVLRGVLKGVKHLIEEDISVNVEDCSRILKRYLEFPTLDEAVFMNGPVFENGSDNESVTWFNKDLIRQGKLKECYNRSYWKNAFKLLLNNDKELKVLKDLIR